MSHNREEKQERAKMLLMDWYRLAFPIFNWGDPSRKQCSKTWDACARRISCHFAGQPDTQSKLTMAEEEFSCATSGASTTYPMQCSALRKNGFAVLKGHPCKIVEMSTSKTGKHGHAKVHMVGLDLFSNKKYEDICPSTHNMDVPNVKRTEYTVVDVIDGYLHLMSDEGDMREDMKLSDCSNCDLTQLNEMIIKEGNEVVATVMSALNQEHIVGIKTRQEK